MHQIIIEKRLMVWGLFLILITSAHGLSIGVSPSTILFEEIDDEHTITVLNPNSVPVTYNIQYNHTRYKITDQSGEIRPDSEKSIRIALLQPVISVDQTDILTFFLKDQSGKTQIIPGISVKSIIDIKKETVQKQSGFEGSKQVYKIRKIIDYDSLKGYSVSFWERMRKADQSKKGMMIIFGEVSLGVFLFSRRNQIIRILRKKSKI
jgi:hypothetical protein